MVTSKRVVLFSSAVLLFVGMLLSPPASASSPLERGSQVEERDLAPEAAAALGKLDSSAARGDQDIALGTAVLLARYDGVYRRPASGGTTASGVKNWEFQVDVMLSYRVETPPFGLPALGPEIVTPVFQHAIAKTVEYAKSGVLQVRTQPQLVSARSAAFEDRFPVNYGKSSTPTTTAYTHEADERPSI